MPEPGGIILPHAHSFFELDVFPAIFVAIYHLCEMIESALMFPALANARIPC